MNRWLSDLCRGLMISSSFESGVLEQRDISALQGWGWAEDQETLIFIWSIGPVWTCGREVHYCYSAALNKVTWLRHSRFQTSENSHLRTRELIKAQRIIRPWYGLYYWKWFSHMSLWLHERPRTRGLSPACQFRFKCATRTTWRRKLNINTSGRHQSITINKY